MRYLLLICGAEEAHQAMEADGSFEADCHAWAEELRRRGALVGVEGLQAPDDATTVRVRRNEVLLTDGPFADTKEVIGGFVLVQCADLDEALEVAATHPAARYGAIEIRPLREP
jgi:hypothetical protein